MAKKTVRILRTLPLEGKLYRANDLVAFEADTLKSIAPGAYDAKKAAVDYCKSIGVAVIEHISPGQAEDESGTGNDNETGGDIGNTGEGAGGENENPGESAGGDNDEGEIAE